MIQMLDPVHNNAKLITVTVSQRNAASQITPEGKALCYKDL
jgi:hypothetical protein